MQEFVHLGDMGVDTAAALLPKHISREAVKETMSYIHKHFFNISNGRKKELVIKL